MRGPHSVGTQSPPLPFLAQFIDRSRSSRRSLGGVICRHAPHRFAGLARARGGHPRSRPDGAPPPGGLAARQRDPDPRHAVPSRHRSDHRSRPRDRRPDRRRPVALHHRRGVAARRPARAARADGLERRGRHAGRRDPHPGRPVRHRLQGQHPEPRPARRFRASGRSRCGARAAGSSRCWSPGWCSSPPGRSPWPWSSFASSRDCSSDRTRARTLGLQHRHLRPRHRPRDRVLPRPARAAAHEAGVVRGRVLRPGRSNRGAPGRASRRAVPRGPAHRDHAARARPAALLRRAPRARRELRDRAHAADLGHHGDGGGSRRERAGAVGGQAARDQRARARHAQAHIDQADGAS